MKVQYWSVIALMRLEAIDGPSWNHLFSDYRSLSNFLLIYVSQYYGGRRFWLYSLVVVISLSPLVSKEVFCSYHPSFAVAIDNGGIRHLLCHEVALRHRVGHQLIFHLLLNY